MEERSETCLFPFEYSLNRTKIVAGETNDEINPNKFRITFEFQVLNCVKFGDGFMEPVEKDFYDKREWICSEFISDEGCQFIVDHLFAGICSNCIDQVLDLTMSEAMMALSNSNSNSNSNQELLSLCIYKYKMSWAEYIEIYESEYEPIHGELDESQTPQ